MCWASMFLNVIVHNSDATQYFANFLYSVYYYMYMHCSVVKFCLHCMLLTKEAGLCVQSSHLSQHCRAVHCFEYFSALWHDTFNSYSASHDNWCTATLWNRIMTAQCEGMGEVGSARYEPALLPPCPSIRVSSYSNCQEIHSRQQTGLAV